jgi:hypothetical protein
MNFHAPAGLIMMKEARFRADTHQTYGLSLAISTLRLCPSPKLQTRFLFHLILGMFTPSISMATSTVWLDGQAVHYPMNIPITLALLTQTHSNLHSSASEASLFGVVVEE